MLKMGAFRCVSMLVAGVIILGTVFIAKAQINLPTDASGQYLAPPDAPCVLHTNGQSTGTVETVVRASGPGYVSWVIISTHNGKGYVTFSDTGSINNQASTDILMPLVASATEALKIEFRPPFRFTNGLTIDMSNADMSAAVCTRLYGTANP